MADIVDTKTRSRMMAGIKGRNTKPELALRQALHALGFRYRLHAAGLPGRPDVVFPRYRAVVQVQGCFWHRHKGCSFATTPASNTPFWHSKFSENTKRDERNLSALRKLDWRVAIVWECSIKEEGGDIIARKVVRWLSSRRSILEIPSHPPKLAVAGERGVSARREGSRLPVARNVADDEQMHGRNPE